MNNNPIKFQNKVQTGDSSIKNEDDHEIFDLTTSAVLQEESSKIDEIELNEIESKFCFEKEEFYCYKNCENEADIIEKINSVGIEKLQKFENEILAFKFEIVDNFVGLSSTCLRNLSKKFKNKSTVIAIESADEGNTRIYWKSKDIEELLTLQKIDKLKFDEIPKLNEFVLDFLAASLKNDQLGLISKLSFQPGMKPISLDLLADYRDFNLLLLAAENGNSEIVEILLQHGMNTNSLDNKVDAQTLAYKNQHFDVLCLLLQENLKFPASFDANICTGKCNEFCEVTDEVHKLIKAEDIEKLKEILNQHKNLKHFYNFSNESALKVAIISGSYETYKELTSRKFRYASHEDPAEYLHDLKVKEKRVVREIHNKFSESIVDKHINTLIGNSFIYHDEVDGQDKQDIISQAYKSLDSIPLVRIILMIVAASKNFKIIFDFNRESVNVADPTVESYTQGLFYVSGRIYVGAKQLLNSITEHETLANLVHELCHYTMNLVYSNTAKPYKASDQKALKEFQEISEICEKCDEKEDIIDMVYEAYPEEVHHAELIVRPVHMLVYYRNSPEILDQRKKIYSRLFEFYEQKVVPELEKALPEIEQRDEKVLERKDQKISKLKKISIIGGVLAVLGIISAIVIGIILYKPVYSFKKLSIHDQKAIEKSPIIYKNVKLELIDLFPQNSTAYDKLVSFHISKMLHGIVLNFSDPHVDYLNDLVKHDWRNMSEKLKEKVLTSNFTFQNESLKFKRLYEAVPKSFDSLTSQQIVDVLNRKMMIISNMIQNETKFTVERRISDENIFTIYYSFMQLINGSPCMCQCFNHTGNNETFEQYYGKFRNQSFKDQLKKIEEIKNLKYYSTCSLQFYRIRDTDNLLSHKSLLPSLDGVLKIANETKIFILSAEGGTGKTETFVQFTIGIKRKLPTRWVANIDLKDHKNLYKNIETLNDVKNMLEKIAGISNENKFEKEIFEELFKSGDSILLWNGFDEISPEFSESILKILSIIRNSTQNIQFICTRPLYKNLLRDTFMTEIYALVPFTTTEQKNFVEKFLNSQNIEKSKIPDYIAKVGKIVMATQSGGFDTPLLLGMIAELVANDVEIYETGNLYEVYRKFVEKKVQIWEKRSQNAADILSTLVTSGFSMKSLYQKYALRTELQSGAYGHKFAYFNALKLKVMRQRVPKSLSNDEISRMGILYINGPKSVRFTHRTFAEFFIAQYFVENIYFADDEPTGAEVERRIRTFYQIFAPPFIKVRNFIYAFLQTKTGNGTQIFDAKISKVIGKKFQKMYFNSLRDFQKIPLMDFFTKDHKVLTGLLQIDADETLYSAIFNYVNYVNYNGKFPTYKAIQDFGKQHLTEIEYQNFTDIKNQKGIFLFSTYCMSIKNQNPSNSGRVFNENFTLSNDLFKNDDPFYVFEEVSKNLTKPELKTLLTSEIILNHITTPNGHVKYIFNEKMWKIIEENFNQHEQKILLQKFFSSSSIFIDDPNLNFGLKKLTKFFSNSEIFEIFSNSTILIQAANFRKPNFQPLWNFFVNHTTQDQQKSILKQTSHNECFTRPFSANQQIKHCYVFSPLNMLQASLFSYESLDSFNRISKIYETYFNKTEMQQIIISSSTEFLPFFIVEGYQQLCQRFVGYLEELFSGNKDDLKKFLMQQIEPTNLNVFELFNDFNDPYKCLEMFLKLMNVNITNEA